MTRIGVASSVSREAAIYSNILIGIDGRAGGRDAVALATRLAAPGASFALAHVDAGPFSWHRHYLGEERVFDRSASMLAAERERAQIPAAIVCVGGRPPARGLHDLARERAADLIVVGSSRHTLLGRMLLGDDARESLGGAPCAVAIAPPGYAESSSPLVEIGVAYDGSPDSEHALSTARGLASCSGANIRCLRTKNVDGEPSNELSRVSSELDLLIVGASVDGSLGRMGHGVSRHPAGCAACPLLVLGPEVSAGASIRAA